MGRLSITERIERSPEEWATFRRNIEELRRAKDLPQEQVDALLSWGEGSFHSYTKGNSIGVTRAAELASLFNLPSWENLFMAHPYTEGTVEIPYWGWVPCGGWDSPDPTLEPVRVPSRYRHKDVVAVRAGGDSMEPKYPDGTLLIVALTKQHSPGQQLLIRNDQGELAVKVAIRDPSGTYRFMPLNPTRDEVTAEQVEVRGRVIEAL